MLFKPYDLALLAKKDLALRLARPTNEAQSRWDGDAIPLSHLGGAKDIIEFLTIAYLPNPPKEIMEKIYNRYKESDIASNDCMPRLILHFAAKHDINDAKKRLAYLNNKLGKTFYEKLNVRSIESEAKKLVAYYLKYFMPEPIEQVLSINSSLAQELTRHFNEKLFLRLELNWNCYANSFDMDYLILSGSTFPRRYDEGYDFNNYPLGKVGSHTFSKTNVLKRLMFLGGENRSDRSKKSLEQCLFDSIKFILYKDIYNLQGIIKTKLQKHSDYPDGFISATQKLTALVIKLLNSEQLSFLEAKDVLERTEYLIDNPKEYRTFRTAANNYQMVSGGQLSAYMLLLAGWVAKILTLNAIGDAWIKRANERLELIWTIEEVSARCHDCLT